jgi:ubiquinone/menaquinone biosynthesis C-methylase UbiE
MEKSNGGPPVSARQVKRANLSVYNRKTPESYEVNRSIFNPRRQGAIRQVLGSLAEKTGGGRILDLGCGTGNLLRLAQPIYRECYGLDLAWRLLALSRDANTGFRLASGESDRLPFHDGAFDVISLYAVLHHLLLSRPTFEEAFRCLRPGGWLYTDHDPNHFFSRFYHVYYRLRHRRRPGFGSEAEELAEYHNTQGGGLNPERLRAELLAIGFREVEVHYRNTDNRGLPVLVRLAVLAMRGASKVAPLRSLHTHFWLIARK